ncbi:MAG: tRNA (adenosine(37)-N6)-threonylcarbamoyltransferase complex ATPase subunit type 1 TsaE [bacterium]
MGTIITKNEEETQQVATNLAKGLKGGEVILMYGDLGAGKTVFAKALAKALGVREVVKSPTFNIMKCYLIPKPHTLNPIPYFCHIDAYRLKNFDELLDIGADEYIGQPGVVTVIEWAERVDIKTLKHKNIKTKVIRVEIEHGKKDNERIIDIK